MSTTKHEPTLAELRVQEALLAIGGQRQLACGICDTAMTPDEMAVAPELVCRTNGDAPRPPRIVCTGCAKNGGR